MPFGHVVARPTTHHGFMHPEDREVAPDVTVRDTKEKKMRLVRIQRSLTQAVTLASCHCGSCLVGFAD